LFKKNEIKKKVLKSMLYNNEMKYLYKIFFDNKYKGFTNKGSIAKSRTYCLFLGNNRSIFKQFKMSRDILKKIWSKRICNWMEKIVILK